MRTYAIACTSYKWSTRFLQNETWVPLELGSSIEKYQNIKYTIFLESYILIPAGILTGMGEATMWPVMGLFVVHYARCYARHGQQPTDVYITQFFGKFYAAFQFSNVSDLVYPCS